MEIGKFIEVFINQFDEIPNGELNGDSKFKNLEGWDSLTALAVIVAIDNEYRVNLTGEDLKKSETFNDLFEIIKSKKANG